MAPMPSTVTKRSCSSSSLHDEEEDDVINELRRGPWTPDEDNLLTHYIACHGEGRWNRLAECSGLKRTGKSCRLRWLNYLKPDIKRGNLTLEEQILIIQLHSKLGNRWSRIAKHLPGRTDNEIKNFWRTKVQKQARQHVVNNATFHDATGCFSIPRVIQNTEKLTQSPPVPPPPQTLPPPTITTRDKDSLIIEGIHDFNNQYHQVLLMNNTSTCRENYCTLSPTSISSSSTESIMNSISTFPENSGYNTTSPDQAFAGNTSTTTSNVDNYAFLKPPSCYYYVMNSSSTVYDTEAFINLGSPTSALEGLLANSTTGRLTAENDWVANDEVGDYGIWK